jgi:hypothetical protein
LIEKSSELQWLTLIKSYSILTQQEEFKLLADLNCEFKSSQSTLRDACDLESDDDFTISFSNF